MSFYVEVEGNIHCKDERTRKNIMPLLDIMLNEVELEETGNDIYIRCHYDHADEKIRELLSDYDCSYELECVDEDNNNYLCVRENTKDKVINGQTVYVDEEKIREFVNKCEDKEKLIQAIINYDFEES